MGRVNRYRKVKRTVQEFGKQRGPGKNDVPLRKIRGKAVMVNGFMLEPDNNKKLLRVVRQGRKNQPRKKESKKGEEKQADRSELKSLRIAPGESLRSFDQRVEKASRDVLSDQIRAQTATAKKRKQFMKDRKERSKLKKRLKRQRKLASKEEEEAELVYQGLKPFRSNRRAAGKDRPEDEEKGQGKVKEMPTRWIGVHNVAERPPEFEQLETDKKRYAKLKFMRGEANA